MQVLEAVIMDQATSNNYVLNIFSACGTSSTVPYAPFSGLWLRNRIKSGRIPLQQRLQTAAQLAIGLANLHQQKLVHGDVKLVNVLFQGKTTSPLDGPLWNDFNFGVDLQSAPSHCVRSQDPFWRCPEELQNSTITAYDACDVYMLGNVLFELLTGREPWGVYLPLNVTKAKLNGESPPLPEAFIGAGEALLLDVMRQCMVADPLRRPTAMQVARLLNASLWLG